MSESSRKTRRDKGTRLLTARDKRILAWVAEQYAIRFDQLQCLLSQDPCHRNPQMSPGPDGVTNSGVLQVISRWERDPQWAEYKRIYAHVPGWVWVTPYFIDFLHGEGLLPKYGRHVLRESTLEHSYWINCVRLDVERRHPEYRWISERSLRAQQGRREEGEKIGHIPDAQIWVAPDKAVAVEVELSPKSDSEIDDVFSELLIGDGASFVYGAIWYFVSDTTSTNGQAHRVVESAKQRLQEPLRSKIQIIDLERLEK